MVLILRCVHHQIHVNTELVLDFSYSRDMWCYSEIVVVFWSKEIAELYGSLS